MMCVCVIAVGFPLPIRIPSPYAFGRAIDRSVAPKPVQFPGTELGETIVAASGDTVKEEYYAEQV